MRQNLAKPSCLQSGGQTLALSDFQATNFGISPGG